MSEQEALDRLAALVVAEKDRIVRLWSKRLLAEAPAFLDIPGKDLRQPLGGMVEELVRLLQDRKEEALRLWPEWVRSHGARRYDQRFDAGDLLREFKALQQVLLRVCARRLGELDVDLAELIAELVWEAAAAAQESFARSLRAEEVRFREAAVMESVLHQVEVGILVAEMDGTLSFATPPVERLIGVPVRSLVGARAAQLMPPILAELSARHPDGRSFRAAEMPLVRALKEQRPVRGVLMVLNRADGKEVLLEMGATPLWEEGPDGGMAGVIQTMADRSATAEKTRELAQAYEELRRLQGRLLQRTRTEALGQLASGAAHALNNFLNVLRLRIVLMRREFKPEHLDALDRTVGNIGGLVSRLQEFSVTRAEEELHSIHLDELVEDALQLARSELERTETPVGLETDLSARGCVSVDEGFFREMVVNLLFIARDRMPSGGKLEVRTKQGEEWLTLRVTDTGPAYSSEELGRLFEPLKGKAQPAQLSLLLAVARSQVQRWGGELRCYNREDGEGATFEVRLPLAQEEPVCPAPREVQRRPRRPYRARQVLVVDDEPENARMLAELLTEEGYEVVVAHSGAEALRAWAARPFQAALLDAVMPEMSGWELARQLRQRSPDVLLAMVTGMDVRGQSRASLALVDAVFRKPLDVAALDEFLSQSGGLPPEREGAAVPPMVPQG